MVMSRTAGSRGATSPAPAATLGLPDGLTSLIFALFPVRVVRSMVRCIVGIGCLYLVLVHGWAFVILPWDFWGTFEGTKFGTMGRAHTLEFGSAFYGGMRETGST